MSQSRVRLRPAVAAVAAARNFRCSPAWQRLLHAVAPAMLPKNGSKKSPEVVDAIVPQQGPNYLLAKRLQKLEGRE